MRSARTRVVPALLATLALAVAPEAHADGDPASDYLISQNVFFSYTKLPASSKRTLVRVVGEANRRGYTVRVALIGARFDLGAVPVFWRRPQPYAKFLSQELLGPAPYTNRVLVVMPNGFGLARSGNELPAERRVLGTVPSADARSEDLAASAARAVLRLAAARGVTIESSAPRKGGGGNLDRLIVVAAAIAAAVMAVAAALLRRRRIR